MEIRADGDVEFVVDALLSFDAIGRVTYEKEAS